MRRISVAGAAILVFVALILAAYIGITSQPKQVTPNDKFFTVSISDPPAIDVATWVLRVDGLVDRPMNITYEELIGLENRTELAELRCVTGPSGLAYYTGIPLPSFIEMIGVGEGAKEIVFTCMDHDFNENYSTSLTLEELSRDDILLAWKMNNVTLPVDQGFPLRLVVPGDWGYKWAKWIVHITVVDYDYKGYWEERGWADDASISPITDWFMHSVLLSLAAVLGGLAAISGLGNSRDAALASRIPRFLVGGYHRYLSAVYYAVLILVFIYWASVTYENRGAVFYTFHGRLALITVILAVIGIATSLPLLAGSDRLRNVHFISNIGGYVMLLITILLGVMLTTS